MNYGKKILLRHFRQFNFFLSFKVNTNHIFVSLNISIKELFLIHSTQVASENHTKTVKSKMCIRNSTKNYNLIKI